jgi:hypothetical protein
MNIISFVAFLIAGLFAFITIILTYLSEKKYKDVRLWYLVMILVFISLCSILYSAFGVYKNNNKIVINSFYIFMITMIPSIIIMNL